MSPVQFEHDPCSIWAGACLSSWIGRMFNLLDRMYSRATAAVEDSTEPPLELDTSPCSHHFSAPDKPKSFEMYDDTGLLATVCRHGIPLRYLSIHHGERFIDVAH